MTHHLWSRRAALTALAASCVGRTAVAADSRLAVAAYRVTAASGAKSTLLGSAHIWMDGVLVPDASTFYDVRLYVIEHLTGPGNQPKRPVWQPAKEAFAGTGRLIRAPWAEQLSESELAQVTQRLGCAFEGMPELAAKAMPLLLALERPIDVADIAIRPCTPAGKRSRDDWLARYAKQRSIPVVGLEEPEEVEARRRSVPDRLYLDMIRAGLSQRQQEVLEVVGHALAAGDFDVILQQIHGLWAEPADADLYEGLMIRDRNVAWIPRLRQHLNSGDAFINVGAGHLGGPLGLVQLLRDAGYLVERTTLPGIET